MRAEVSLAWGCRGPVMVDARAVARYCVRWKRARRRRARSVDGDGRSASARQAAIRVRPRRRRRWLRWLLLLPVVLLGLSLVQVLSLCASSTLRSTASWPSAGLAVGARGVGQGIAYEWRDLDRMAPQPAAGAGGGRGPSFETHQRVRLQGDRKGTRQQTRSGRRSAAAAPSASRWQRTVPVEWTQLGAQGHRGLVHRADRSLLAKHRILEMYANIAEFGDGVYGAQAASRQLLRQGRQPLTPAESARLAAVLPAPTLRRAQPGALRAAAQQRHPATDASPGRRAPAFRQLSASHRQRAAVTMPHEARSAGPSSLPPTTRRKPCHAAAAAGQK